MNVTEKFAFGDLRAVEAAVEHEREQRRRRSAPASHVERPRGTREQRAARCSLLQLRRAPQRRERDERDDQHDRRRPAEQPHRDRQVGLADDAVRLRRWPAAPAPRAPRPPSSRAACGGAGSHARRSLCNAPMRRIAAFARHRGARRAARTLSGHARRSRSPSRPTSRPRSSSARWRSSACSTRAACARSRRPAHPVPGWRQACFYARLRRRSRAALTSLGAASQELLYVHMVEHLLLGDIAALLIVLGLTGPLIAPILRIRLLRPPARARRTR